jgi:hypothetical protein
MIDWLHLRKRLKLPRIRRRYRQPSILRAQLGVLWSRTQGQRLRAARATIALVVATGLSASALPIASRALLTSLSIDRILLEIGLVGAGTLTFFVSQAYAHVNLERFANRVWTAFDKKSTRPSQNLDNPEERASDIQAARTPITTLLNKYLPDWIEYFFTLVVALGTAFFLTGSLPFLPIVSSILLAVVTLPFTARHITRDREAKRAEAKVDRLRTWVLSRFNLDRLGFEGDRFSDIHKAAADAAVVARDKADHEYHIFTAFSRAVVLMTPAAFYALVRLLQLESASVVTLKRLA